MEVDITGPGQTSPQRRGREAMRVSARMGLSGETTIQRLPGVVNFLYFLNDVCTHCIRSFIKLGWDSFISL